MRSHGRVHAQGNVEFSHSQFAPNLSSRLFAVGFVENDKLEARNVAKQARLCLANDPRDGSFGPGVLNGANDGECVTGIANCRETNNTDAFGR